MCRGRSACWFGRYVIPVMGVYMVFDATRHLLRGHVTIHYLVLGLIGGLYILSVGVTTWYRHRPGF